MRARTALRPIVCLAVLASAGTAVGSSASLESALGHRGLGGAKVGALVVRGTDGAVLFAHHDDALLAPASNMKVLTAVAALSALGPTHRFTTAVYGDFAPDGEGAVGRLWVRGGGDPALTSEELWRLAADLRLAGVRRVSGIFLDDGYFDADGWNSAWGDRSPRAFHASVSALTANYGTFGVAVAPSQVGRPARVAIDPPIPYLALVNQTSTVSAAGGKALDVDRRNGADVENVVVSGTIVPGMPATTIYRSVVEPTLYAGWVLRMQLEANGIAVDGPVRRGAVPGAAAPLIEHRGKALAEIAPLLLKYSNNNIAEMLLKDMGAEASGPPGTWEKGLAARRVQLGRLGIDVSGCTLLDGSGLSARNRVTPRVLVQALRAARTAFGFGPEFIAALPIAGRDGTLEHRAPGAIDAVRAKTGLLSNATGLSGYARLADGGEVVFSVLANDYKSGDADAMAALDGFVTALVQSTLAELSAHH